MDSWSARMALTAVTQHFMRLTRNCHLVLIRAPAKIIQLSGLIVGPWHIRIINYIIQSISKRNDIAVFVIELQSLIFNQYNVALYSENLTHWPLGNVAVLIYTCYGLGSSALLAKHRSAWNQSVSENLQFRIHSWFARLSDSFPHRACVLLASVLCFAMVKYKIWADSWNVFAYIFSVPSLAPRQWWWWLLGNFTAVPVTVS